MRTSYPGVSDQIIIDGPIHDLFRAHHHDSYDRSGSYVFEDMYPEFDITYGGDVAILHYRERDELRRTIFGDSEYEPMGHEIYRETLRNYAVTLTRLGIMNFRFREPGSPGDHDYIVRLVYFDHQLDQSRGDFPPVQCIVTAAPMPWDDNDPEEVE